MKDVFTNTDIDAIRGTVERVHVMLGYSEGNDTQVLSGLKADDVVVSLGHQNIINESIVQTNDLSKIQMKTVKKKAAAAVKKNAAKNKTKTAVKKTVKK